MEAVALAIAVASTHVPSTGSPPASKHVPDALQVTSTRNSSSTTFVASSPWQEPAGIAMHAAITVLAVLVIPSS
jgi:hypothetical protein